MAKFEALADIEKLAFLMFDASANSEICEIP
jgi:hypothetical protein